MNHKLVIFDCDGVLVDSEPIANRVFAEQVVKLGVPMTSHEAEEKFAGIQMAKAIDQVEGMLGRSVPNDFESTFRTLSFEAFKKELLAVEGITQVLSQLTTDFCLASNGPRNKIELNLAITGLDRYFTGRIFSAYELNVWKPSPHFYLKVAEAMQTRPSECVVVEDTRFGAEAASSAGIRVLGYTAGQARKRRELDPFTDSIFDHMNDLIRLLNGGGGGTEH